ncbi:hypothetical protein HPC49_42310 [Pyxidicoccus fallax]|uniref:Lipoprotein n=1 Tax=Pyxidicoccus fallax TaxID=394095 RepID=A0A848LYN4_9BACT|nr:hypothetical protein [Pyxidicoccus fallax]NMO22710.1 hypothetical protein [Pyxidicoccus fallax]NPC84840.1 hypothetical protein [Pyxidicoccus fallax]
MRLRPLLLSAVLLSACASRSPAVRQGLPAAEPDATASTQPPAPMPDVPPVSGEYGTAHPFVLQAHAPDGRWLVACQAREDTTGDGRVEVAFGRHGDAYGDVLRPYLFLEPGPGTPIDDLLASDTTGRYLVLVRDGALQLLDTHTRAEEVLAANVTADATSARPPVRAMFSRDGTRLLFLRPEGAKVTAVVRDLKRNVEHVLDAGGGLLGQAMLDPSGQWVAFDVVAEDTDGDGTLAWPLEGTTLAPSQCRGPVMSSSHFGWQGDRPVRRFRPVEGGALYEGLDILQPLGSGLLRMTEDQSILFEHRDGRRETWLPSSCDGELLYADAARQQLLVSCATKGANRSLELYGPGVHQSLGWSVSLSARPEYSGGAAPRLLTVPASRGKSAEPTTVLVDLERRAVRPWPVPSSTLEVAQGPVALLREEYKSTRPEGGWESRLWLWNAQTEEKVLVGEPVTDASSWTGDMLLYRGWLMDLRSGRVLGTVEGEPLSIDTLGRALRPRAPTARSEEGLPGGTAPLGPVWWEPAVKADTPKP